MTQQHPFSFFIEFATTKSIDSLKEEFFANAGLDQHSITFDIAEEWRTEFNLAPGGVESYPYKLYFKDYLEQILERQASLAMQQLDLQLIKDAPDPKKAHVKLGVYLSKAEALIALVTKAPYFKKYPAIRKTYERLSQYTRLQLDTLVITTGKSVRLAGEKQRIKLQWTDSCKTLTQLFYALYHDNRNGDKPFIKVSTSNMVQFLADNFVGKDGLPYEPGTIEDGLKPRSIRRRAKSTDALNVDEIVPTKPVKSKRGTS